MSAHPVAISFEEDFALIERHGEVVKTSKKAGEFIFEIITKSLAEQIKTCPDCGDPITAEQIHLHNDYFELLPMDDNTWARFKVLAVRDI